MQKGQKESNCFVETSTDGYQRLRGCFWDRASHVHHVHCPLGLVFLNSFASLLLFHHQTSNRKRREDVRKKQSSSNDLTVMIDAHSLWWNGDCWLLLADGKWSWIGLVSFWALSETYVLHSSSSPWLGARPFCRFSVSPQKAASSITYGLDTLPWSSLPLTVSFTLSTGLSPENIQR